jgi:hypothetical protein
LPFAGIDELQRQPIEKVQISSPNRSRYRERADRCVGMIRRELSGVSFDRDFETRSARSFATWYAAFASASIGVGS